LDAYRQKLDSGVRREQRIAVWGVGEYGKPSDAAILKPMLSSKDAQLRRLCLASYAKLLESEARTVVIAALKDPSPQVATEAARICIRQRLKPEASELAAVLREGEISQRLTVCLSALEKSGKWERLIFIFEALNMGAEKARLLMALSKWNHGFNLSYTQPSEAQVIAINHHLALGGVALDEKMAKSLDFTLKPYGISVR
jgi:HEAT repeat protein